MPPHINPSSLPTEELYDKLSTTEITNEHLFEMDQSDPLYNIHRDDFFTEPEETVLHMNVGTNFEVICPDYMILYPNAIRINEEAFSSRMMGPPLDQPFKPEFVRVDNRRMMDEAFSSTMMDIILGQPFKPEFSGVDTRRKINFFYRMMCIILDQPFKPGFIGVHNRRKINIKMIIKLKRKICDDYIKSTRYPLNHRIYTNNGKNKWNFKRHQKQRTNKK